MAWAWAWLGLAWQGWLDRGWGTGGGDGLSLSQGGSDTYTRFSIHTHAHSVPRGGCPRRRQVKHRHVRVHRRSGAASFSPSTYFGLIFVEFSPALCSFGTVEEVLK
jgi:hypothetical protein